MPTAVRAFSLVLVLALPLALAACGGEPEAAKSAVACDIDPELGVTPRALGGNGIQGNGIQGNKIALNGIQGNRIAVNGIDDKRIAVNGVSLNGISLNGVSLNGVSLNGVSLNAASAAGNELVAVGREGAVVSGEAFIGATIPALLSDGRSIGLVITAFERSSSEPDLAYYDLAYEGQSLCEDGAKGMFVSGVWDERGARRDDVTVGGATASVTFSCVGGVIAKCARWGYAPWKVGAALHQTCTRMARADYCGTGISFTRDGTSIDMFDVPGVQAPANEAGFLFEAGWNESGATCVSRPRYAALDERGAEVLPSCWRDLPRCASWDEAKASGATPPARRTRKFIVGPHVFPNDASGGPVSGAVVLLVYWYWVRETISSA